MIARALALTLTTLLGLATTGAAAPIPDNVGSAQLGLPRFQGAPFAAKPMTATKAPRHPYLAPNPRSNIHNDTWMTDAYAWAGPLGRDPLATSSSMSPAVCGSLTFDSKDRIVSVCPSLVAPPEVRVIDPKTLEIMASYDTPFNTDPPGQRLYQNFAGGGYFFLDGRDRIWSATKTGHLFVLQVAPDGRSITLLDDYDLTSVLEPDERITSALPDFRGRIWFVSKRNGKVAVLDTKTRKIVATLTDEAGRAVQSEKVLEIVFAGGKPVRAGDQFGIGGRR